MGKIQGWTKGKDNDTIAVWSHLQSGGVVVLLKKDDTVEFTRLQSNGVFEKKMIHYQSSQLAKRQAVAYMRSHPNG